ncbi:hypothetical protein GCM10010193_45460 [Kitasatospora atroaurantiaca]
MALSATGPAPVRIRPYRAEDQDAVLALIADDRLTGQPETTAAMLTEALAGYSPTESDQWAALDVPRTAVAHDPAGRVLGAASYTTRSSDQEGFVLWLHSGEDLPVASALIDAALADLGPRTVHAFAFASALSLGLQGLPVRSRPATRKALESVGFSGRDQCSYLHRHLRELPHVPESRTYPIADVQTSDQPPGRQLYLRDTDGALIGEAALGEPVDGIGVLQWIEIGAAHRGRGLGGNLLTQCCDLLAGNGGHELIAYLPEDPPRDSRLDQPAAGHLLATQGFEEIDTLCTFTRGPV